MVVQNVKIVVLEDMVMVAKNVKQVSIAHLLRTTPRTVPHVILEDTNRNGGLLSALCPLKGK